jgi:hypothetical protein
MFSRRFFLFLLPVAALLSFPRSLSPQVPPAAVVSTGTKIGTIIKDAINVALPDAAKLIETLFAKSDNTNKKTATPVVEKQATDAKTASDAKLSGISAISAELSVVSQYLEQTVPASQKVARLLSRLDNAGSKMPSGVKSDWDDLNKSLQKLNNIKASDINKVDEGLRLRLLEIRGIYDANTDEINSSIKNDDISGLRTQLRAISALLNSVVAIAGIEITSLQSGLESITKPTGVTPQGIQSDPRVVFFETSSADNLTEAKRALTKPYNAN